MLLETLLMVVAVGAALIMMGVVIPKQRRMHWEPTWDNLARLCAECEHELRFHDDRTVSNVPAGCRAGSSCGCRATRQQAFPTSLTRFELQARKELHDL